MNSERLVSDDSGITGITVQTGENWPRTLHEVLQHHTLELLSHRKLLMEILTEVRGRRTAFPSTELAEMPKGGPTQCFRPSLVFGADDKSLPRGTSGGGWQQQADSDGRAVPRWQRQADDTAGQVDMGLGCGEIDSRFFMAKALGFLGQDTHAESTTEFQASDRNSVTFMKSAFPTLFSRVRKKCPLIVDNIVGGLLIVNAVMIGIHSHRRAEQPDICEGGWDGIFLFCNVFFTLELMVRIALLRKQFFLGSEKRWNLFDVCMVTSGAFEEILHYSMGLTDCVSHELGASEKVALHGLTALRIMRVLRVVRVLKAFRTMSIFRELRVMVDSTLCCLGPLAWACVLLGLIHWCFSIYFLQVVADAEAVAVSTSGLAVLDDATKPYKAVRQYFGSLDKSMLTLFGSITGGVSWDGVTDALSDATKSSYPTLAFLVFIALTTFAVLNVITGIFVENATKQALKDRDLLIQEALSKRDKFKEDALRVFNEADADGSGELTLDEFMEHLENHSVQAFLENMELDAAGARRMFRLIDLDEDGKVSAQEFVIGCMCLKGGAKTMDVAALLREVHKLSRAMNKSVAGLNQRLDRITVGMASRRYEQGALQRSL